MIWLRRFKFYSSQHLSPTQKYKFITTLECALCYFVFVCPHPLPEWLCHSSFAQKALKHKHIKLLGRREEETFSFINFSTFFSKWNFYASRFRIKWKWRIITTRRYIFILSFENEIHWFQMMMPQSNWSLNKIKHSQPTVRHFDAYPEGNHLLCMEFPSVKY